MKLPQFTDIAGTSEIEQFVSGRLGLKTEYVKGNNGDNLVIKEFVIPGGKLDGKKCDIALACTTSVPYIPHPYFHVRPCARGKWACQRHAGRTNHTGMAVLEQKVAGTSEGAGGYLGVGSYGSDAGGLNMTTTPRNLGVALTGDTHGRFLALSRKPRQELTTLFYWRPSIGRTRYSAIIDPDLPWPRDGETIESGNVAIKSEYMMRVLAGAPRGAGIGVIHSHFGNGWQNLSDDDHATEAMEFARVVFAAKNLPLLGMTIGLDGALSARLWLESRHGFRRADVPVVRVVGERFLAFHHPDAKPRSPIRAANRIATMTVWGPEKQALLESLRIGVVGLGSVGSMVTECLARMGVRDFVLVDRDRIKKHNLDRTVGASPFAAFAQLRKARIAARNIRRSSTSHRLQIKTVNKWAQEPDALKSLLDCDAVFACVDRHLPKYVLDFLALSHLVPVVDGGIAVETPSTKQPSLDISWRIHLVSPLRPCLSCLEGYDYSKVGLERDGLVDNRTYLENAPDLKKEYHARQNVFCFSMSCAAHEVLQFLGYVLDTPGLSPVTPQMYQAGAGLMFRAPFAASGKCKEDCQVARFEAKAHDLGALLR